MQRRRGATRRVVPAVVLLVGVLAAACSSSSNGGGTATGPAATQAPATSAPVPVDYREAGPYAVGQRLVDLGDRAAIVYYPVDPSATANATRVTSYSSGEAFTPELRQLVAGLVPEFVQDIPLDVYEGAAVSTEGPFPVVLHSHGAGGYFRFESGLMTHLASWGYVVASPDHKSRNLSSAVGPRQPDPDDVTDLKNLLALLDRENATPDSPLKGGLDLDKVGAEGHSAGGRAVAVLASDPASGVDTFIGIQPAPPVSLASMGDRGGSQLSPEERIARTREALQSATKPAVPSMIIQGDADGVIPLAAVEVEYEWLAPPKRMVVVSKAGHNLTLDICARIREQGGLMKYQDKLPQFAGLFRLGEDGCTADSLDPATGLAIARHLTVAHYRWVFGDDATDAALDEPFLTEAFGSAIADVRAEP